MRTDGRFHAPALSTLLLLACGSGDPPRPDGGADAGDAPGTGCRPVVGGPAGGVHVLRFESAAGTARVHLRRRFVQVGAGESVIYGLEAMWIERQGDCVSILEAGRLVYTNSHHNWRDRAAGSAGSVDYQVTMDKDLLQQTWSIRLTGTSGTTPAFPAVDLLTTGGPIGLHETPSRLPVMITELMPETRAAWRDQAGEPAPWIELWNPSSEPVDLGGWALSNDPAERRRWLFPAGTMIARHQVLVVAADGQPGQGPLHTSFALAPGAGSVVLTDPRGVTAGERSYPAVAADRSVRFAPQSDGFEPSPTATPGDVPAP